MIFAFHTLGNRAGILDGQILVEPQKGSGSTFQIIFTSVPGKGFDHYFEKPVERSLIEEIKKLLGGN